MAGQHPHEHSEQGHHRHGDGWRRLLPRGPRPHSHDAAASVDSALEASERGMRALRISFAGLMVTAALQLLVVAVSGSVALLADTIHNFSDALTAVPLLFAFRLGRRPATPRYTYGYRRAEDLAGVLIVVMIALSAGLAAWEAAGRLLDPRPLTNLGWVFAAGVVGFAGNELVALYRIREGRAIGSAALVADGHHARTDGLTSLAVAVGAAGVWLGFEQADPIAGLVISVAILAVLLDAGRQVFGRLMDAVEPDLVDQLERVAAEVPGVRAVTDIRARWNGHRLSASLAVVVDPALSVAAGHAIGEQARHALLHGVRHLDTVTVHVDPLAADGEDHHAALAHHPDPLART